MQQEIHFVTGKGGVGKSAYAAALALKKSKEGRRVLLVELGDQSFYKDFFDLSEVGFHPQLIRENLSVALWTGEACLREYAKHLIKVESLTKIFFENAVMKAFINVAPGLPELAILGKVTSNPRKHGPPMHFDCIVVDAFATGHFLALLRAPKGLAEAIKFGPMGEQSRSIDLCLKDSELCKYHIVTLAEELPLKETIELAGKLENDFSIHPHIIVNKILDPLDLTLLKHAKDIPSDIGKFASYLEYQLHHQSEVIQKIAALNQNVKTISHFYELRPWVLIEKMMEQIRWD